MRVLPIDDQLEGIVQCLARHRAVVVVAPPGSGKTTRVPPALAERRGERTLVLQPRRVAARALARHIASERGWEVGNQVGWHVRHERRFSRSTRLVIATEGILTRRLVADPLLSDTHTVVLDEFHERSLHTDLGLALLAQALEAREDLELVVMSATLDPGPVARFLGGCPVVDVDGRLHPVEVRHAPGISVAEAARSLLAEAATGHVLCFLPGAREIRTAERALASVDATVLPLHGGLDAAAQDRALAPSPKTRKLILATNLAETSLTIDGVSDVIDGGLVRVARYDAARGIDRLDTERVTADAATQRAGRAGRTGPGRCLRLWDSRDTLRPEREPDIRRVDLAGVLLDVIAWGGDPRSFGWFESPPQARVDAALGLLGRLGAIVEADGTVRATPLGVALRRLPLHPRLARVVLAMGGTRDACRAAAVLSERDFLGVAGSGRLAPTTHSDLALRLDRIREAPASVLSAARELERAARTLRAEQPSVFDQLPLARGLLAGYPDRVARRRRERESEFLLHSGTGATLARGSGVRDAEFVIAIDVGVRASDGARSTAAVIHLASAVDPSWLVATDERTTHRYDAGSRRVRATVQERYGAIVLDERPTEPDPARAAPMLAVELARAVHPVAVRRLLSRARFAGIEVDTDARWQAVCFGRTTLPKLDEATLLEPRERHLLTKLAPEAIVVPSGRSIRLDYREDGNVVLAVKLQELFGLGETPTVGPGRTAVTLELLAPNGRPVQTTRDLMSFWRRTYPEVRRELRGRYPKHPWPEDPWTAAATARTKRRAQRSSGDR